ncbi:MAG: hypothetical protein GF309_00590 [Candidatus Lokiarchaeota archaeon]|nr:hypothetical protein [Candidatus Lokiarchaeota archaeon]
MSQKPTQEFGNLLVVMGGIIGLIYGLLDILGWGTSIAGEFSILGPILGPAANIVLGIVGIVVALIILATSGMVDIPALKMEKNWIILVILGIVLAILDAYIPGIIVIIGALLTVV